MLSPVLKSMAVLSLTPIVLELSLLGLLQALLQAIQGLHGGQALGDAGVGFAAIFDCREELAILKLDAIHRHVYVRNIDGLLVAVDQIVIVGDVGSVVADVAEKGALRTLIVER